MTSRSKERSLAVLLIAGLLAISPMITRARRRYLTVFDDPRASRELTVSTTVGNGNRDVVLTSWYTYARDPQRKVQVSSTKIDYIHDLYVTATHFKVPLVVFHDGLADDFVAKYANDHVSFRKVKIEDPTVSTNDLRFFPYLKYVEEEKPDSILMVDASDTFFNRNPFEYIHTHEGPDDQLFMSDDRGVFNHWSWMTSKCYGSSSARWPAGKLYNAGVWGGKGPAVRCILDCVTNQLNGILKGRGNCNMPAVNYCVNHGPCKDVAPVHEDPQFVNPLNKECDEEKYDVIHNKCSETQYKTTVRISEGGEVTLVQGRMSAAGRKAVRQVARRCERTGKC
eukprot:CAMPEP_0172532140 /NCGR_PEP_ID=MMETSP1067-20121228/5298_1 /TAXON_ID=265564 ORGANISM="Thalassiosira punctigera, Strain Tpunct2005C2" /NCGR_SAMPLE_ID=MMETSP1067 /ASSEMBLY_ACC=CAM_ASM_000444 /LENGTH=337 /DNA_ID=CAMNT_0013316617 /DNA_START=22 /DNA_END=1035 /DNA_ORIENTATION=-